jgi:hypothetical protein
MRDAFGILVYIIMPAAHARLMTARWFIPVNVVLGAFLGCLLGYVIALIVRPPPQFFNFFVIMIGIGM